MAQEFTIKSQLIEDKINQLLPSQGGFEPGVDFSASTMVIPIVDLTETAEGSNLREDLQSSLSLASITAHDVANATSTIINTPGYFRIYGTFVGKTTSNNLITIDDGTTTKTLQEFNALAGFHTFDQYDFIVKLEAGDSVKIVSTSIDGKFNAVSRQIADLQGNLVNP